MKSALPALLALALTLAAPAFSADASSPLVPVGVAKIDITPELPIRLAGYQSRATEATSAETRLYARALAIGANDQTPVVLVTAELVGISEEMSHALASALAESHGIERASVALCATHTHTGPALAGVLPFMFSQDLPPDQIARIERYTATLQKKLIEVARAALADRKPSRLAWGEGKAGFAGQRRTIVNGKWTGFGFDPQGSTDHALPVLRVTDEEGRVRAVFLSYACHCTTLTGKENFVHADWAGDASAKIEAAHPGAVALIALGCGGDANPEPRGLIEHVARHGTEVATEVERVLGTPLRPLGHASGATFRRVELELDHAVTREELQKRLSGKPRQTVAYAATKFLQQLDAGQSLPTSVSYPVQTWTFGKDLALVFLGGEVVSDYSLRLKRELDGARLWVNAYANAVPCYIAAKRMFSEGGYEVDASMDYYGWPTRLAIDTEDRIVVSVANALRPDFAAP